jgi:hypothetical protein
LLGPALAGGILPSGGDCLLARRDGVMQLDVRLMLRTDEYRFRVAPVFETGTQKYLWLNRLLGTGRRVRFTRCTRSYD